ncbi:hypothetical protein ACFVDQ_12580 [Streptomyces sp. NPDC057684]|uniref:hypothetical protein n=1 Tax=Streptomyces sp. NPDC057684 TaxID=3346211 RepID=UPI0036B9261E
MASAELSPPSAARARRSPDIPEPWHGRHRTALLVTACILPLHVLWLAFLATGGGDLAAQVAWAEFAKMYPGSAYNLFWYGGLHIANYSLISPYLMALFGVVPVTLLSGVSSTWLAASIVERSGIRRPLWPALVVGFSLWCQVVSGRSTFMLGVAFGLGAVLAHMNGRRVVIASVCAALSTMASPVAGLFLVVAGAAWLLDRQWGKALSLLLPPVLIVGVTTWLFPFKGEQPMPFERIFPPLILCAVVLVCAPRAWRVARIGTAVYALGVVLTYLIATPIGTNVERLTEIVAPALLLASVMNRDRGPRYDGRLGGFFPPHRQRVMCIVAIVLSLGWLSGKTIADVVANTEVPEWAIKTDGVVSTLKELGAERTRVEVVPARDHREAAVLAPYINMARGWNRQADVERGRLFYEGHGGTDVPEGAFSSASYHAWLSQWAVGFVVVYNGEPDGPAELEHKLVSSEPDYLESVWRDANWRIYRVKNAVPLVDSPGSVVRSDGANLVVRMPKAGSIIVRIAYSPWLWADSGCLREEGEFTRLTVKEPGDVRISSQYGGPSGKTAPECVPPKKK